MEASNSGGVSAEDFAKLQAMAEQATKTAEEAKTAAEARETVAESVKEEGEAQGIKVDQETAEMIASVTIAQIEARGGFGQPAEEAPPAPPAEGAPPVTPPEGEAPPRPAPEEVQEEAFEPPRKKSLAERFQNK